MFKTIRGRLIVILIMIGTASGFLYDHYQSSCAEGAPAACVKRPLKLGLDLQGGMHLVLEVDDPDGTMSAEAKADAIDRIDQIIRTRIDEFGVEEPLIQQVGGERLIVELAGIQDEDQAKSIITTAAFLEFKLVMPGAEFEAALDRIDRRLVASLGVDSIRAMGRDVTSRASEIEQILFGGGADTTATDSTLAADSAEAAELALQPFSSPHPKSSARRITI